MLGSGSGFLKKKICVAEVKEVIIPTHSFSILPPKYKNDKSSRSFVRFIVYEIEKKGVDRKGEKRKIFIHDHREKTLRAALHQNFLKRARYGSKAHYGPKALLLSEAVRLPARVNVMEMEVRGNTYAYINLFEPEVKTSSGLLLVLSELLTEERLSLDKIVMLMPMWSWGKKEEGLVFGPTGDVLPVVALTSSSKKIIFHCRKSRDVVTLSSRIERVSLL